jgi:hypothetical protein
MTELKKLEITFSVRYLLDTRDFAPATDDGDCEMDGSSILYFPNSPFLADGTHPAQKSILSDFQKFSENKWLLKTEYSSQFKNALIRFACFHLKDTNIDPENLFGQNLFEMLSEFHIDVDSEYFKNEISKVFVYLGNESLCYEDDAKCLSLKFTERAALLSRLFCISHRDIFKEEILDKNPQSYKYFRDILVNSFTEKNKVLNSNLAFVFFWFDENILNQIRTEVLDTYFEKIEKRKVSKSLALYVFNFDYCSGEKLKNIVPVCKFLGQEFYCKIEVRKSVLSVVSRTLQITGFSKKEIEIISNAVNEIKVFFSFSQNEVQAETGNLFI